ncbi:hypothetical protein BDQ17DRAFT_1386693 [Cyathus striatus]|nr:hypothetical protein BDQ17DRAFT_1386693 [Cyathus striatus]
MSSFDTSRQSSKESRKEPRSSRRRKEKREKKSLESTPTTSRRVSPKAKEPADSPKDAQQASTSHTFEENDDFIPFTFSDPEIDDEVPSKSVDKGKGKERARDDEPSLPESSNSKSRKRSPPPEREWDRGKSKEMNTNSSTGKYDLIFDEDDWYTNKKQRMDAATRRAPWVNDMNWDDCKNVAELLHREVEAFVNWISPTPVEDEVRGLVVDLISTTVKNQFPDAQVLPFGSYQTKLYLPLGDIDLVIISDAMAYSNKVTVLHALANTLKRAGITSHVTIIAKAKVPIVKFVTSHGRFSVDMSINQENGVVSGNIVNGFLRDMHGSGLNGLGSTALRSLVMITKAFLGQRSMNEVFTGGLGSYSIVCLAVSFLQMHPKIRRGEIDAEKNLGVLVMEFFELYGCYFNYDEVGISLRNGGTYFPKRERGWFEYHKRGLLSIEDPADPIKTAFAGAHTILTSTAYLRATTISSRRSGRSFSLRGEYKPEDLSILSSVMGITQETINHRKLVQEVYDKRIFHNILGVDPRPIVVNGTSLPEANGASGSGRKAKDSESVNAAWKANGDSDDERDLKRRRWRSPEEDEDRGRYDIGRRRQPPIKRRKFGNDVDAHTVFVSEDEDEHSVDSNVILVTPDIPRKKTEKKDPEDGKRRRSYWLSKGIGMGEEDDYVNDQEDGEYGEYGESDD